MVEPLKRSVTCPSGELTVRIWQPHSPSWLVLLAHGYGEHSGRYQWLADQLTAARALVWAPDHIGHGRSPGERVLIENAERVVADLDTIRRRVSATRPDLPIVLIGLSLGGMLAVRYAQQHRAVLSAFVLSAPVLGTWHVLDLLEDDDIVMTSITPEMLSHDPQVGRNYVADPLVWHGAYKRTTLTAIEQCLHLIDCGPALEVPTLWLHGDEDEIVPEADTRTEIERLRGGYFHEHVYPGKRHDLFNEVSKGEMVHDMLMFLKNELKILC